MAFGHICKFFVASWLYHLHRTQEGRCIICAPRNEKKNISLSVRILRVTFENVFLSCIPSMTLCIQYTWMKLTHIILNLISQYRKRYAHFNTKSLRFDIVVMPFKAQQLVLLFNMFKLYRIFWLYIFTYTFICYYTNLYAAMGEFNVFFYGKTLGTQ